MVKVGERVTVTVELHTSADRVPADDLAQEMRTLCVSRC